MKDLCGHILANLYRKRNSLRKKIYSPIHYLKCFLWKVSIGKKCSFLGLTTIYRAPESSIKIGNKCRFNSNHTANFRGINHPCIIQTGSKGAELIIGNNCGFSGTSIVCNNKVIIEDNVICGANTSIGDRDGHSNKYATKPTPIHIKEGAWLGMNVVVLKGVTIGRNAIIGATSLVTKDIPDNAIAAGIPCKVIKYKE